MIEFSLLDYLVFGAATAPFLCGGKMEHLLYFYERELENDYIARELGYEDYEDYLEKKGQKNESIDKMQRCGIHATEG